MQVNSRMANVCIRSLTFVKLHMIQPRFIRSVAFKNRLCQFVVIFSHASGNIILFYTNTHDLQQMNTTDFGDPLTFHVATPLCHISVYSSNTLVYDSTPAKLIIFPSASGVLCLNGNWQMLARQHSKHYTC